MRQSGLTDDSTRGRYFGRYGSWKSLGYAALVVTALLVGAGVGVATPVAFSHLAASTPPERMGRTMGSAELGRELGDAGGPLVAGAVATASVPGLGLAAVAVLTTGAGGLALLGLRSRARPVTDEDRSSPAH